MIESVKEPSLLSHIPGMLEDHVELLQLECRYEGEEGRRRLLNLALAALCVVSSFAFFNVTMVYALWRAGISPYVIGLGLTVLWGVIGIWIGYRFCQRNPRAGEPFAATQNELKRSLQWIQKLSS